MKMLIVTSREEKENFFNVNLLNPNIYWTVQSPNSGTDQIQTD